jgi:hypothetical protein
LGIEDDEIDDLVFEDEADAPVGGIKWMALVKVHTMNYFSSQTFEQHMRVAWSPAREISFRSLENNMFTIQCFCLGDWLKITKGGPWLFRQNAVTIEEYDGLSPTETIDLNHLAVWVQIHKLPDGYRGASLVKNLAERKIGSNAEVDMVPHGLGDFIRVKVKLDLRKPLARFVTISRAGQREFFKIQFEKVPKFCGACGMVGHSHLECGTGEHDESKLKWGDFLKADRETWYGRFANAGNRGGSRSGRGGPSRGRGRFDADRRDNFPPEGSGRGRGAIVPVSWRYNAIGADTNETEEELQDTGSSPVKKGDVTMSDSENSDLNVKRRLEMAMDEVPKDLIGLEADGVTPDNMVSDDVLLGTNDILAGEVVDRKKRSKKAGADSPSLESAGSFEGPVRSQ